MRYVRSKTNGPIPYLAQMGSGYTSAQKVPCQERLNLAKPTYGRWPGHLKAGATSPIFPELEKEII